MIKFLIIVTLIFSSATFADKTVNKKSKKDLSSQMEAFGQLFRNMKLDKGQIKGMINLLVSQGKISKVQGEEAKKKLMSLSDKELSGIQSQAIDKMQKHGIDGVEHPKVKEMLKKMDKAPSKAKKL